MHERVTDGRLSRVVRSNLFIMGVLLVFAGTNPPVFGQGAERGGCIAPEASIAADHVIVAVEDFEAVVASYNQMDPFAGEPIRTKRIKRAWYRLRLGPGGH